MKKFVFIFGIDVSKDYLDIYDLSKNVYSRIPNNLKSILKWIDKLDKHESLCVFEPTGSYSDYLFHTLMKEGISMSLVNPLKSSNFAAAQGIISKNDKQAAKSLALMGECLDLPLYKKTNDGMYKRKQLLLGISALKKQRQMLRNQLHALEYQVVFVPKVIEALEQTLVSVESNLAELERELNDLSDDDLEDQKELLQSIIGLGTVTTNLLLAATGGLQNFQRARQLSKFVGVINFSHESGTSVRKKRRITKSGNAKLRSSLYMAARSAKTYNLACKELYERLRAKGKPHKQAMVAVMNKLLKQAFGVVSSKQKFDNHYYLAYRS